MRCVAGPWPLASLVNLGSEVQPWGSGDLGASGGGWLGGSAAGRELVAAPCSTEQRKPSLRASPFHRDSSEGHPPIPGDQPHGLLRHFARIMPGRAGAVAGRPLGDLPGWRWPRYGFSKGLWYRLPWARPRAYLPMINLALIYKVVNFSLVLFNSMCLGVTMTTIFFFI